MSLELVDIVLTERHPHPRLENRINGKVRATLVEVLDEREYRHNIDLSVWIDGKPEMSEADVELALLVKGAGIVARLKSNLNGAKPAGL